MTLKTPLAVGSAPLGFALGGIYDSFGGSSLNPRWTNLSASSAAFDPVGVTGGSASCLTASATPGNEGTGGAFTETGLTAVKVTVQWSGNAAAHKNEGALAMHAVPGTAPTMFGVWPSSFIAPPTLPQTGTGILLIGSIGNPPSDFSLYNVGLVGTPTNYTTGPHVLSATSNGTQLIALTYDGISLQLRDTGLNPVATLPIPAALQNSTKHGFCCDSHLDLAHPQPAGPCVDWIHIGPP